MQVLRALEAAQKEPKAPLSDLFTDGMLAACTTVSKQVWNISTSMCHGSIVGQEHHDVQCCVKVWTSMVPTSGLSMVGQSD